MGANPGKGKREATEFGRQAEEIAAAYLLGLGYTIRERNWKGSGKYEVDLIAQKDNEIVLVEVKARKGDYQEAVDAVDSRKMRQMVKAADAYIGNLRDPYFYRFDIIAITGTLENYRLEHFPNAFLSPLSGTR